MKIRLNGTVRCIVFLSLVLFPLLARAQSDFSLSTADLPKLEDAIIAIPPPMTEPYVRQSLDMGSVALPKPEELLKQVVNGLKTRQFASALPKLEYLQALQPNEPDLLILRGCLYAELGRPDAAEGIFKKVIVLAPSQPFARLNLSEALLSQKKFAEAEQTLVILSSKRPESEVVRFKLVMALVLQKKFARAEQELQYLQDHAKTPSLYFARAALAFAHGDRDLGTQYVEDARRTYGESQISFFYGSLANQDWVPKQP